ncbi:MAG TPA: hypothetical protein VN026_16535 [Bacteroidia bacterium]|jgi:hypothetical protein|nr:hypothetical protein [Bacteroidia bacterium]
MGNAKFTIYKNKTENKPVFNSNNANVIIESLNTNSKGNKSFYANKLEVILNDLYYNVGDDRSYTFFGKKIKASLNDSTLLSGIVPTIVGEKT